MVLRVAVLANRRVLGESVASAIGSDVEGPVTVGTTDPKRIKISRRPEVVLVVGSRSDGSTAAAVAMARRRWREAVIIALADSDRVEDGMGLVRLGADTWLSRSDDLADLRHLLRRVAGGERQLLPAAALAFITSSFQAASASPRRSSLLSAREAQVLVCLARGLPRAEIAAMLGIALPTLRTHIQNILRKLELHSVREAIEVARLEALVPELDESAESSPPGPGAA